MRKTLDQIALTTGAGGDKASDRHDYCRHYAEMFEPLRDKPIRLLEIGIGEGSSMKIWLEYFPDGRIAGVDVEPKGHYHNERQISILGDQTSDAFWGKFHQRFPLPWDIIIDDGSHKSDGIITSFRALWPKLKPGGFYCIEDLKCSYMPGYQVEGWIRQMEFVKSLLDCINFECPYTAGNEQLIYPAGMQVLGIEWMRFSAELCILKKK